MKLKSIWERFGEDTIIYGKGRGVALRCCITLRLSSEQPLRIFEPVVPASCQVPPGKKGWSIGLKI